MTSTAKNPDEYFILLPEERKAPMLKLRKYINNNIPKGFEAQMSYGMVGWVVPHSIYPPGYHCNTKLPLPFVNLGSQKKFIALHHMGIYANPALLKWFVDEYPKHSTAKLDMGKGCIRFKKMDAIPYKLIAELMKKVTVKDWIGLFEKNYKKK
jgi:hypothetical protein